MNWLLFLPQLPASPSTLRVTVWRRMRTQGALGLQNGVWVLPDTAQSRQFIDKQFAYIKQQGATGYLFEATALEPETETAILAGFQAERNEEYAEFCERCDALLAELDKETTGGKFTFAELEETETDLHKLEAWLAKITARDFMGETNQPTAREKLAHCRRAYEAFAQAVYSRQGIEPLDDAETQET